MNRLQNKKAKIRFFRSYGRYQGGKLLRFAVVVLIFCVSFWLYHLPLAAVLYPALLCGAWLVAFEAVALGKAWNLHQALSRLHAPLEPLQAGLPPAETSQEAEYQALLRLVCEEREAFEAQMATNYAERIDYYTTWAHQIKIPIASMRLHLQAEDSARSRQLQADLFCIEQYAEMVLVFLRLDSDSTDYVFRSCDLDRVIRQSVRKFAGEFIGRKIRLDYQPVSCQVVTDEKWLSFVLEQLLSNALKYTPVGSVQIFMPRPQTICIRDTGMGIDPADLPRIFEKGYTGFHGRTDQRASGIGLYLCKRICDRLNIVISVDSTVGQGTTVTLQLQQYTGIPNHPADLSKL